MAYNDTSQEFINSLNKENCPPRWIEIAKEYKKDSSIVQSDDQRRLYDHIIKNILEESTTEKTTSSRKVKTSEPVVDKTTSSKKVEDPEPIEEPKYESKWEDEVEGKEDFDVRVHAKVADEYGDMKSEEEE